MQIQNMQALSGTYPSKSACTTEFVFKNSDITLTFEPNFSLMKAIEQLVRPPCKQEVSVDGDKVVNF
jgi:hypothetical protein